ncbi:hypothetical protein N7528_003135 [Penicillium herquei]|nr:hypothetical protein N7528_003135 [Penicillium herquei]
MTFVSPQNLIILDEEITPCEHYRDMVERLPREQKYDLQREVMLSLMEWARAEKIHKKHLLNLAYIQDIKIKAIAYWGQHAAKRFFTMMTTKSLAEQVSKLLTKKVSFQDMPVGVNREICDRLSNPGRGHRSTKSTFQGELQRTAAPEI